MPDILSGMQYISEKHRKRTRKDGHDYARPGWYFVTIVTRYRLPFFGEIVQGVNRLNAAGIVVEQAWHDLPERFPIIRLDAYVVMPNHLHGIIGIRRPTDDLPVVSLSRIVGAFKSLTTNAYSDGVIERGWEPFEGHLWQRSFHDQIIRSRSHLDHVRAYINDNPRNWEADDDHPGRHPRQP